VKLEQDLGANPMNRFAAITGGEVAPLIAGAASAVETDLNALPNATFAGLQYSVVDLTARPFFYVENCSDTSVDSITSIIGQAVVAIPPVMSASRLTVNGPLMAVEPRVVSNQYCYQVGYPYAGRQPRALLIGKTGETPAGQALRVVYTGEEANVIGQVYDPMDALLGAAHLDNPATREDDWVTYEVYNDDAAASRWLAQSRNLLRRAARRRHQRSGAHPSAELKPLPFRLNAPATTTEAPATTAPVPATTTP
jgi:hypothetical protein